MRYDSPSQPKLDSILALEADFDLRQFIDDLRRMNGVGSHIPRSGGGLAGFRLNDADGSLEVYRNGAWQTAVLSTGGQTGDGAYDIDASGRVVISRDVIVGGDLSVSGDVTLADLSASRLVATDSGKALASVADLTAWIAGTANRVTVANDGDGTVTLSLPQDIHTGASPTFVGLTLSGLTDALIKANGSGVLGEVTIGSSLSWADPTLDTIQGIRTVDSPTFVGLTLSGLTVSRLISTTGAGVLTSAALVDYVAGAANQVTVGDDGDGSVTLSLDATLASLAAIAGVAGDIIYASGVDTWTRLAASAGRLLQSGAGAPAWFDLFGTANVFTAGQTIDVDASIPLTLQRDGIGITNFFVSTVDDSATLTLQNTTAATSGVQQAAILSLEGYGWRSSASQLMKWMLVGDPRTDGNPQFAVYVSLNAGSYSRIFAVDSGGQFLSQVKFNSYSISASEEALSLGMQLADSKATTVTQQYNDSPYFLFYSQGWKTGAGGASQYMSSGFRQSPEPGVTNPIGVLKWFYGTNTLTPAVANELFRLEWGDRLGVVFNDQSLNGYNFRVEGDTDANLIVTDGATNAVKIGGATTSLIGFYGVTAVDQPATVADPIDLATCITAISTVIDRLQELGLIA